MLSNGQPIEQAPHSMQFPKLTSVFFCSWFHSYTPAGQKWVQYLPVHSDRQTFWSVISMCGLPVSSLYLTVNSLSVSLSISRLRTPPRPGTPADPFFGRPRPRCPLYGRGAAGPD